MRTYTTPGMQAYERVRQWARCLLATALLWHFLYLLAGGLADFMGNNAALIMP